MQKENVFILFFCAITMNKDWNFQNLKKDKLLYKSYVINVVHKIHAFYSKSFWCIVCFS